MAISPQFASYLVELFDSVGHVAVRRMFGGAGIFYQNVMIALYAGDTIYLKVDAASDPHFEAKGLEPFVYETQNGRRAVMSFRQMPESCFDDPDDLNDWARLAIDAAFREDAKKPPSKRKRKDML